MSGQPGESQTNSTSHAKVVQRLQRRPYGYALALVLACASLITLVLVFVDSSISAKDKLTQIGTGLAASTIFALIYTILANREFSELIRAEIADQLTDHLNRTLGQIKQLNELFLPSAQYPAGQEFNLRFNKDLTNDLRRSNFYYFRGTSGKYVPARLKQCDHHLDMVQAILLDPRDKDTIEARARDRRLRPEHDGKSIIDIAAEIRNEILLALVALFDCREVCDIEIGFSTITSPVRIEILENAIYTSLYRSAESERNKHPEAVRFSRDSQTYQIFRDDYRRHIQLSSPRKRFTARDTDQDICEFARSLQFDGIGAAELEEQRAAYRKFIASFADALVKFGCAR